MKLLSITVLLVLLVGTQARVNVQRPPCDSPEAEEAALVAQDYLNGQHAHGYKYALNRIEDIKIFTMPDGANTYVLEVDLLETDCHALDPTPLANCSVRPKTLTAVEGDCDVVLKKVNGTLAVTAFKCKTEESTEDLCLGCPTLLPLNDTAGLNFVHTSLATVNNRTDNIMYTLLEVGRMSTQIVSGGPIYSAEYIIVEANCTASCPLLSDAMAARGICYAKGLNADHTVDCKMFPSLVPAADANSTAAPALPPKIHMHKGVAHSHGFRHHKLTAHHNPHLSSHLSAESVESVEDVPKVPAAPVDATAAPEEATAAPEEATAAPEEATAAPADDSKVTAESSASADAPAVVVKRDVPAAPVMQNEPVPLLPLCPGRIRYF